MRIEAPPIHEPKPDERDLWSAPTRLLDFDHPSIARLIADRGWADLPEPARVGAAYGFVRDEIEFGYNARDDLPASAVLADGIGQCNTKSTLLMALLRALAVPCQLHGFTIDKTLQRGAITGLAFRLAPRSILHGWVEAWVGGRWVRLEGVILDSRYLQSLQRRFRSHVGPFSGFGVSTRDLQCPAVDWSGGDTFIQRDGIDADLGLFDSPDAFFARYGNNVPGPKQWLFAHWIRHRMNANVAAVRAARSADRRH
ncbi:MAG: transglutaminase domain-containing protein [Burkholderiaceae bacterium]